MRPGQPEIEIPQLGSSLRLVRKKRERKNSLQESQASVGCLESGCGQACWPSTVPGTGTDLILQSQENPQLAAYQQMRQSTSSQSALFQMLHTSHIQLASNGHEDFQDGHETRDLTETAAAHHLGVNQETLLVVPSLNAVGNFMETHEDGWRKLQGGSRNESACSACNTGPPPSLSLPPVLHLILTKQHLQSQGRIACSLGFLN